MPCRPAISSHSLGRAWVHEMGPKLDQAARYGFDIELFYEDLNYLAQSLPGGATLENQISAAKTIRSLCDERGISIVCLQPFMQYEGLRDRQKHQERVEEMKHWIRLAQTLHTSIIAIPSTSLLEEDASGDMELIAQDLREVADLAAAEGISIAYESLAWGTYASTWEQAWAVVEKVDRSNFGVCIDTFNMAGKICADPTKAPEIHQGGEEEMRASLRRFVERVDVKKILFVQVVDGEQLAEPLVEGHKFHDPEQSPLKSWSRNCRLFYGEENRGGFLPVRDILKAIIVDLGFEGWISAELFHRSLAEPIPSVPQEHAKRAADSWNKIVEEFGLEIECPRISESSQPVEEQPRAQL